MKPTKLVNQAKDLARKNPVSRTLAKGAAKARDRALSSKPGKALVTRAVKAVTALDDLAGRSVATRAVKKALGKTDVQAARQALQKVVAPSRKMPETIRTTGGKRLQGATAAKAVRRGSADFKPKKGKKG
jgi:hypothetical protein